MLQKQTLFFHPLWVPGYVDCLNRSELALVSIETVLNAGYYLHNQIKCETGT